MNNDAQGRLRARPLLPTEAVSVGLRPLQIDGLRDGLLYIPRSYQASQPAPLVLMLHGAGGSAQDSLNLFDTVADAMGLVLLAIDSRQKTWDIVIAHYGADIRFIDQALQQTFNQCAIDTKHIAIAGFSDGASYALSVGITNGDLFTHVIAFSPGFLAPAAQRGSPRLFVSHGTQDPVLPIATCSRRIVPLMQRVGYDVAYREFDGAHSVPPTIVQEAMDWFVADPGLHPSEG